MKKSFILYLDSLDVLDDLTHEQIAELFIAIKNYHSGSEVKLTGLMKAVFTPFKNQFDRDNEKYQSICERNKTNGAKGGRPKIEVNPEEPKKPNGLFGNPEEPKKPNNDNDSETDSDNKNDTKFNFKKSLLDLGIENQIVLDWLKVRKNKKATDTETAFNKIKTQIDKSELTANECIKIAVENSWSGFNVEWLKNIKIENKESTPYKNLIRL